jgi:hypothetical protein
VTRYRKDREQVARQKGKVTSNKEEKEYEEE